MLETRSPNPPDNNPGGNNGVGGKIAVHIVPIALSKNIGYSMPYTTAVSITIH